MRRIYESNALRRETGPFTPHERRAGNRGPSTPDSDDTGILDTILPSSICRRAISIRVSTPQETYEAGSPVPFQVELHNRMPFSVSIRTPTPLLWTWEINGMPNAAHVKLEDPPADKQRHAFSSGERKRFVKHWPQRFRRSKSEWERAEPGMYTIGVQVNFPETKLERHTNETEVEIVPEA